MADDAGAVAVVEGQVDQQAGQPQQQGPGVWGTVKALFFRMLIIYFISSLIRNWRQPSGPVRSSNDTTAPAPMVGRNMFAKFTEFDLYVYISESGQKFSHFNDENALFWKETDLLYGDWTSGARSDGSYIANGQIPCSESVQNNGSIYIHVFIVKAGSSPDPNSENYSKRYTIYHSRLLNKFKKKRYQKTANLLTGETEQSEEDIKKAETMKHEILSHWHPNLTLNLIDDQTPWTKGSLPPPLDEAVRFDPVSGDYFPIFFFNDYWNLQSEFQPINETVKMLNLTLTYVPMSLFKWQIYASQQMRGKWASVMGMDMMDDSDEDQDSLKQAILETNPYLLGITIVVSILHTVCEFMAFKNDIQFWRSRKSLEGLSVRSVLFSMFTSLIVLLYICDNDTNFVVKMSVGVGMLIELWKIPKVLDVSLDRQNKVFGIFPRIKFADKGSYVQSATKEYDQMAFRYLSWLLYPLLAGYAIYSLTYLEHRGWYSWVLNMLYGFLLTFGFIMMTPQLFINYKLKSVAHLPWRMLTYKFINTFIDDLFAFVIRMPTMYRIGCFRDDIVFLVYVYQRWIYRVDPKRVNEFGTSAEMEQNGQAVQDENVQAIEGAASDNSSPVEDVVAEEEESKKDK